MGNGNSIRELQFGVCIAVIDLVGEVSEEGPGRLNPRNGGKGFLDIHVGGMRAWPQGIDDKDLKAIQKGEARGGDLLHVAEVSEGVSGRKVEAEAKGFNRRVYHGDRGDGQVSDTKRSADEMPGRPDIIAGGV